MNIKICDVCYYKDNEFKRAEYKVGFTGTKSDVCEAHKNYFDEAKTGAGQATMLLKLIDKSVNSQVVLR